MLKIMDEKDTKIAALSDQVSLLSSEKAQMAAGACARSGAFQR